MQYVEQSTLTNCRFLERFNSLFLQDGKLWNDLWETALIGIVFHLVHFSDERNAGFENNSGMTCEHLKEIKTAFESCISQSINNINNTKLVSEEWGDFDFSIVEASSAANYSANTKYISEILSGDTNCTLNIIRNHDFNKILKKLHVPEKLQGNMKEISKHANSLAQKINNGKKGIYLDDFDKAITFLKLFTCSYIIFRIYFNKSDQKYCISQNPYSPIECGMLVAANNSGVKTWYLPHGLPQRSMFLFNFDVVSPLTMADPVWRQFNSKMMYMPWCEGQVSTLQSSAIRHRNQKLRLLFFSQLSGAALHKVDYLLEGVINVIKLALLRPDVEKIRIRLRSSAEEDLFRRHIGESPGLSISKLDQTDIQTDIIDSNCLLSSSSTALLYGQKLNLPVIQIVDNTVIDTWPYQLTGPERIVNSSLGSTAALQLSRAIRSVTSAPYCTKMLFKEKLNLTLFKEVFDIT